MRLNCSAPVITLVFGLLAMSARAPDDAYAKMSEAIHRLEQQRPGSTADLERRLEALRNSRGAPCTRDEACADLWQTMTERALERNIVSHVTIKTSGGDGAVIRYQTLADRLAGRNVLRMKGLSTTREDMAIGNYYIWAERNGKATSSKTEPFQIVKATEDPIGLEEH